MRKKKQIKALYKIIKKRHNSVVSPLILGILANRSYRRKNKKEVDRLYKLALKYKKKEHCLAAIYGYSIPIEEVLRIHQIRHGKQDFIEYEQMKRFEIAIQNPEKKELFHERLKKIMGLMKRFKNSQKYNNYSYLFALSCLKMKKKSKGFECPQGCD